MAAFGLVCGAGNGHIGYAAGKGYVVVACVGGAISPYQPSPVKRKYDGQILQSHVVQQLVVSTLQKGGVDGYNGFKPLARQASGKGYGVLLGYAYIKIALWILLVKLNHARAFAHGGGDAYEPLVVRCHIA